MPLIGLTPDVCVCVFNLSLSITVLSPELWCCSSSWKRRSRTAGDGGSSPGGDDVTVQRRANDFELGEAQRRADFEVSTCVSYRTTYIYLVGGGH